MLPSHSHSDGGSPCLSVLSHRSSPLAEGVSFGVLYMARLVVCLITTTEESEGAPLEIDGSGVHQALIARLSQQCLSVVGDVPMWEEVLSCAHFLLRVVHTVASGAATLTLTLTSLTLTLTLTSL